MLFQSSFRDPPMRLNLPASSAGSCTVTVFVSSLIADLLFAVTIRALRHPGYRTNCGLKGHRRARSTDGPCDPDMIPVSLPFAFRSMRSAVPAPQLAAAQFGTVAVGAPCAALGAEMQQHAIPLLYSSTPRSARLLV